MGEPRRSATMPTLYESIGSASTDDVRKRVSKACDRCRLKKIKCDGKVACSRCQADSTICRYGERKKSVERRIPPGYVDYLEEQQKVLVQALRKLWNERAAVSGQASSSAAAVAAATAEPSVNEILSTLGVLNEFTRGQPGRENFVFEEDLDVIRRRLEEEDDAAVTSASSARSSPGRSSIPAPAEPFRDPFTNQGTLSLPSASQFRFTTVPQPRNRPFPAIATTWPNSPVQLAARASESPLSLPAQQQQQHGSAGFSQFAPVSFGQPSFLQQDSAQDMEWNPEPTTPANYPFASPGPERRLNMSPAPFGSFRSSPQPQPQQSQQSQQQQQQQQQQAQQQSSQYHTGFTPAGTPWPLPEEEEAWRSWINERRE